MCLGGGGGGGNVETPAQIEAPPPERPINLFLGSRARKQISRSGPRGLKSLRSPGVGSGSALTSLRSARNGDS